MKTVNSPETAKSEDASTSSGLHHDGDVLHVEAIYKQQEPTLIIGLEAMDTVNSPDIRQVNKNSALRNNILEGFLTVNCNSLILNK